MKKALMLAMGTAALTYQLVGLIRWRERTPRGLASWGGGL